MNTLPGTNGNPTRLFLGICLAGLVLGLTGCGLLRRSSQPNAKVSAIQLQSNSASAVSLTVLQLQVMRFADGYVSQVAQAVDDFGTRAGTPKARLAALRWKLGQATSIYTDATGVNPVVNALDVMVLVTVSRMVMEDYAVEVYGDDALPVLAVHRQLETNIWEMSSAILKPEQQQELRNLIQEWRLKNPHLRYVGAVRFREFVSALGRLPPKSKTASGSIFSLLYLDPFAGLDPTAAAIEETRELGERAMYYTQRMPQLISWQTELLGYELAVQPESRQILTNADQLAESALVFAKTAQQLPQLINDQRQAAIQQLLDGLQSQHTNVQATLTAGAEAATAINGAIQSLDQFVRYVSPTNTSQDVVDTNSRPFNVLDYGTAAGQVGGAAKDLNDLLAAVNQSAPQLAKIRQQTASDARRVVHEAFWLGLVLILVFLAGSVAARLIYHWLGGGPGGGREKKPEPGP
jgi:hypothetical protein